MARVRQLRITNYRSVRALLRINFPPRTPLVLIGAKNSGKSNIVRALDLLLGESWPGSREPEDHEFHSRNKDLHPIEISAVVDGVSKSGQSVLQFIWRYSPGVERPYRILLSNGDENPFVSNEVRDQCCCIVVGADRRLSYLLGYQSKYTWLSKLMRDFHQSLTSDQDRVALLRAKFEELKSIFDKVEEFAAFNAELARQSKELAHNLEYGLDIDFSAYDPSNYFHALRVFPKEDDDRRTFEELGTGQEQILALSFAYAYAKAFRSKGGLLLVIEEPEAHLHPLAQAWLSRQIRRISEEDGIQVVVTTHSPAFVNMLSAEGLVLVRKEDGATQVAQLTKEQLASYCRSHGAVKAAADTILQFYASAATDEILAGFFARRVVLVEGPTEALALPIYLERVGFNTVREGVALIPVQGKGNLAKWWRLFTAYGIPTYMIFDNDSKRDPDGRRRKDALAMIGLPGGHIDSLISGDEWVVGEGFSIFGKDFENTLRHLFPEYGTLEERAWEERGLAAHDAKPLVARFVAEHIDLRAHPDAASRFMALGERITAAKARTSAGNPSS